MRARSHKSTLSMLPVGSRVWFPFKEQKDWICPFRPGEKCIDNCPACYPSVDGEQITCLLIPPYLDYEGLEDEETEE